MLTLDVPRLLRERGVANHTIFMQSHGISPEVWRHLKYPGKPTISMELMEKLCLAFNCSPNELFCWSGSITKAAELEKHPLQKLRRSSDTSIFDKLSALPAGKLDKLRHMVDELAMEE